MKARNKDVLSCFCVNRFASISFIVLIVIFCGGVNIVSFDIVINSFY